MKVSVFFSFLWHAHRSHFLTHPNAQCVIIRRFRQGSAFWGLEKLNLKFDPLYAPKNVKIGNLSWRSMENCSRPNSATVSRIQFKLGTRIEHTNGITCHDSKVKRSRSQRNVTYPARNCNNSVLGGRIKFILGSEHAEDPPTSGAQNGCHDNAGCLATGTQNLHFHIEYFKN